MSRLPSAYNSDFGGAVRTQRLVSQTNTHQNLSAVLSVFSDWRAQAPTLEAGEGAVIEREVATASVMNDMHDSLHESDRLHVYRFFLTAVHRNASILGRFTPSNVSSPERQAAIWAEYESVSFELDELIHTVAGIGIPLPGAPAQLLAADFLWSMAWWVHARRDVLSFIPVDERHGDLASIMALGREPDPRDHVGSGIYEYAAISEEAFRECRENGYIVTSDSNRNRQPKPNSLQDQILQKGNHL